MVGAPLGDFVVARGAGSFAEADVRILLNLLLCVMAGFGMYVVGKIPVLNWALYPPSLPRGRANRVPGGRRRASAAPHEPKRPRIARRRIARPAVDQLREPSRRDLSGPRN